MDVQFTDREIDVMEVLWERGPSLVAEVRAALSDELAYTTVLTILRTLEGKGYVSRAPEGRGHRYFAAVKQTADAKKRPYAPDTQAVQGIGRIALRPSGFGSEAQ
jgi:Predicted transcriptional regulator